MTTPPLLSDRQAFVDENRLIDREWYSFLSKLVASIDPGFKAGFTTWNLADATATQQITGVGFQPKAIIAISAVNSTLAVSWGLSDGTSGGVAWDLGAGTAYGVTAGGTLIGVLVPSIGNQTNISLTSFDNDGFTLTWTKAVGAPAGTATLVYLVIR